MNTNSHDTRDRGGLQGPDQSRGGEAFDFELAHRSSSLSGWQSFKLIFKVIEVRLRFIAILVIVALFVGYWDSITNRWEKQTRASGTVYRAAHGIPILGPRAAHWLWPQAEQAAVASGAEYYCPMHPTVVRESLEPDGSVPKCPICGMPLSLRKKGETPELPDGVLSRKQYSPEQIQAAGMTVVEVGYQPLQKEITTVGYVTYDESRRSRIVVRVGGYLEKLNVDKPWVTVKQGEPLAEIYSPELYSTARELLISLERNATSDLAKSAREKLLLLGVGEREIDEIVNSRKANHRLVLRAPFSGHLIRKDVLQGSHVEAGQTLFEVADLSRVWIEAEVYESDIELVRKGQAIEAVVEAFPGRVFAAKVALVHPHLDAATRTNAVRFEVDNPHHELRPGMFATVRIKTSLADIEPFRTRIAQGLAKPGQVLAVPERAVIDTGEKQVVYVERSPGLFDGVGVTVGMHVDEFYPVIEGLMPGDRVADHGAFLVDAETRLNPAAASTYVGSGGGHPSGTQGFTPVSRPAGSIEDHHSHGKSVPLTHAPAASQKSLQNIAKLAQADRQLARAQKLCPITGQALGSMGVPYKITLQDRPVFLCCPGCIDDARKDPEKVLKKVAELMKTAGGTEPAGSSSDAGGKKS